jgi:hypothetical protein
VGDGGDALAGVHEQLAGALHAARGEPLHESLAGLLLQQLRSTGPCGRVVTGGFSTGCSTGSMGVAPLNVVPLMPQVRWYASRGSQQMTSKSN